MMLSKTWAPNMDITFKKSRSLKITIGTSRQVSSKRSHVSKSSERRYIFNINPQLSYKEYKDPPDWDQVK